MLNACNAPHNIYHTTQAHEKEQHCNHDEGASASAAAPPTAAAARVNKVERESKNGVKKS
jgi:hypothetical protein